MLLASGTPSLLSYCRFVVSDDGTTGLNLFSDTTIKQVLNQEYLLLRESLRDKNVGFIEKISYANSVADQVLYTKPSDLIEFISVTSETEGANLSLGGTAASGLSLVFLRMIDSADAYDLYLAGETVSPEFVFHQDTQYGILGPPDTSGTNSIRIHYQGVTAELSSDTSEPTLPLPYHQLICFEAAATLRGTRDLGLDPILSNKWQTLRQMFKRATKDILGSRDDKMSVAGMPRQEDYQTRAGFIVRRHAENT